MWSSAETGPENQYAGERGLPEVMLREMSGMSVPSPAAP
jgi:hypothetical protein